MTQPGPQIEGLTFVDHLGTGGYSDVYLYERRSPRMRVAVKVLKAARLSESERRQFAAEAETMAELADHPYIVQVFSTDTTPDGRPYLVMKYYPPPNMGVRAAREKFTVASVLRTGIHISSAVEAAHRAGILHRDIKPANLLVSQYGEPGLTDFGIAGLASDTDDSDDLGVSIPWAAPEVLSGASNGAVASDVYSLGATLWSLLVGRSPFELPKGDNTARALMGRVLRSNPPATGRADVPPSLERLLAQTMSKAVEQRPRSALGLARALQTIEQEQRFARTEIVVEGLRSAPAEHSPPSGDPGDRTRTRTPTRVSPQQPVAEAPRLRESAAPPTANRPLVTAAPAIPLAAAGNHARERIQGRPPKVEATVLRPLTPVVAEPAQPAPRRRFKRLHAGVIAAAVVLVLAVIGVILAASGGKAAAPGPTSPAAQDTEDLNLGDAPTVTATYHASTKLLQFDWTVPASERDVTFIWMLKSATQNSTRTAAHSVEIKTSTPAATCISVEAVSAAGGPASTASAFVCGAA